MTGHNFKKDGVPPGEQRTRLTINNEWTEPVPVEFGKNIIIRFSKEYFFVTIKITGEEGASFTRTIFGNAEQTILAPDIAHIREPRISFCKDLDEPVEVDLL